MATIAARRIVEHLRGARYRVMKRPSTERAARRELAAPYRPPSPKTWSRRSPSDCVSRAAGAFCRLTTTWPSYGQAPDRAPDPRWLRCFETAAACRPFGARAGVRRLTVRISTLARVRWGSPFARIRTKSAIRNMSLNFRTV